MCILLTVTEKTSLDKKKLTKGIISSITQNADGSAKIFLQSENIEFDTVEPFDWVTSVYKKLAD